MSCLVRDCRDSDVPKISRLYFETVRNVNSLDYSSEQIEAWAPHPEEDAYWLERFRQCHVFVGEQSGEIVGFAEFHRNGHVDCFYVHHERQRQGIGRAMMEAIEADARANGIGLLFAEVSLTARRFFECAGFVVVNEAEKTYRSCALKLFEMERKL